MHSVTVASLIAALVGVLGLVLAGLQLRQSRRAGYRDDVDDVVRRLETTWPGERTADVSARARSAAYAISPRSFRRVVTWAVVVGFVLLSGGVAVLLESRPHAPVLQPGSPTSPVPSGSPSSSGASPPSPTASPAPTVTVTVTATPVLASGGGSKDGGSDDAALLAALGAVIAGLGTAASGAASVISMSRREPRRRDARTRYRGRL